MIKLLNGDCFDLVPKMPQGIVHFIYLDPPYFITNDTTAQVIRGHLLTEKYKGAWDSLTDFKDKVKFARQVLNICRYILHPNGSLCVSGTLHNIYIYGFLAQATGWFILNDICWWKAQGAPDLGCRQFRHNHETILWMKKTKTAKHIFNYKLACHRPWPKMLNKNPGTQMSSVWKILPPYKDERALGVHPTQKPLALMEQLVLILTNEGQTVLDPFMGSGTLGVVCKKYNRNYIGIEQEPSYFELAQRRVSHAGASD